MDFIVGTFNVPALYALRFEPGKETLQVNRIENAAGPHSWLSLSPDGTTLYCTTWSEPTSGIAAYRVERNGKGLTLLNQKNVAGRPGYVCCSDKCVYTVGGATGEVFAIGEGGIIGDLIQELNFSDKICARAASNGEEVPHGDFGGLRHGAHSCDLSPDGKLLYVADIGRNCVWVYEVTAMDDAAESTNGSSSCKTGLKLVEKSIAPRSNDGPRHACPHPNGNIVYSLQEHSNMVDAFRIQRDESGSVTGLKHCGGVSVLPPGKDCAEFWADEVRLSSGPDSSNPRYLFASTRGLHSSTKGYVSVFALREDGTFKDDAAIDIWMTPTSGGIANAIEPAPFQQSRHCSGIQYLSLTDSEHGLVMVLGFDGKHIREICRTILPGPKHLSKNGDAGVCQTITPPPEQTVQAATALWL
ncbi:hypothetical protein NQ176_g5398 [Zarea fungicola]|uniref:Uncharacterized protein n=1 Tax=Zarea fungicola TaxID=93591 RepID=A0ACC1N9X6_9HYPO|nr:hypothetical protein NQ176_g5398 [Lecanicillium fungicola]